MPTDGVQFVSITVDTVLLDHKHLLAQHVDSLQLMHGQISKCLAYKQPFHAGGGGHDGTFGLSG